MTELILLAGFLGAGKTTLMKRLIAYYQDKKLLVIVNEFGRRGSDGTLLRALTDAVTEICDGSIFCACRVQEFEDAIKDAVTSQVEMVLVESSGFSDPVSIRTIIDGIEGLHYKGCVTLAGADSINKVINTSRIVTRQLSVSDLILLNRIDTVSEAEQTETLGMLAARYPLTPILPVTMSQVDLALIDTLRPSYDDNAPIHDRDISLRKLLLRVSQQVPCAALTAMIRLFAEDSLRVKGIVKTKDGSTLVDCIGAMVQVSPYTGSPDNASDALNVLASDVADVDKGIRLAQTMYPQYLLEVIT